MKRSILSALSAAVLVAVAIPLMAITGDEILTRMDGNRAYKTVSCNAVMRIYQGKEVRTKKLTMRGIGDKKAITKFTNPEDEGTKYLKLGKDMWIYFPEEQETVKISGHMLKEGMMGSDVSYEDALESDTLKEKYDIVITSEKEMYEGHACYLLTLTAKVKDAPYEVRKMWVDKETFVGWKQELYAKSGKLLKESRVLKTDVVGGRIYPVKSEMVNKLRKDTKTEFEQTDLVFDTPMNEAEFSLRYLQR
ncbi:MAG: outer membrane lipoprotein-sorting protein [Spirochaetes bacterium]|nr:outer membrane lipoprotein-sorting protein [Spirochaetota bacterium]